MYWKGFVMLKFGFISSRAPALDCYICPAEYEHLLLTPLLFEGRV